MSTNNNDSNAPVFNELLLEAPPEVIIIPALEAEEPEPEFEYEYPVETIDGSMAEEDECTRVYTGYAHPQSRYAVFLYYTEEQREAANDAGDIDWVETRNAWYSSADTVCGEDGEVYHGEDIVCVDGRIFHNEDDCVMTDGHGENFIDGDSNYVYCDDGDYWPRDECHYCNDSCDWVHCDEEDCDSCNAPPASGRICEYHGSPDETKYRGCSPFLIGFEVEKNSVFGYRHEGDDIGEYDLFAGWERDASCGIEGITHCYDPLDQDVAGMFLDHVREARDVLAEPAGTDCGGHINVSHSSMTPRNLLTRFRMYAPLWYALFRHRLNNTYCREDKKIEDRGVKYSPVRCKSFGIEIRLPSRVINADHLTRRFHFTALTCRAIDEGWTFNRYVRECRPLLLREAYNGDRKRYAKAVRLARSFRVWMLDGVIHERIVKYLR